MSCITGFKGRLFMRMLFLFIAIFSAIAMDAQTLRTFKGSRGAGDVTYTYYFDEDGKEVKHGSYRYIEKDSHTNPVGSYSNTVTGAFKNGKLDGIWTNTIIKNDYGNTRYDTSTIIEKHVYKNGVPDGVWTYTANGKYRTKEAGWGGWKWSAYSPLNTQSAQITWKDGILIGNYRTKYSYDDVSGQLNNNMLVGVWKYNDNEYHYTNDGILMETIEMRGGFINKKYDKEIKLYRQYIELPIEERDEFLAKNRLKVSVITSDLIEKSFKGIFENSKMFTSFDGIKFPKYIEVKFKEPTPIKDILKYDLDKAENKYILLEILDTYKYDLSNEDIELVKERIKQIEIEIEDLTLDKIREKCVEIPYEKKIQNYFNLSNILNEYKNIFSQKDLDEIKSAIEYDTLDEMFRNNADLSKVYKKTIDDSFSFIDAYNEIYRKNLWSKIPEKEKEIIESKIKELGVTPDPYPKNEYEVD